jgi:tRNA splicing endonuclease
MTETDYLNAIELLRVTEYEIREYIKREQSRHYGKTTGVQMGELDNAHCSLLEVLRLLEIPKEGKHRKDKWDDNKFEEDADYLKWVEEQSWEGRE